MTEKAGDLLKAFFRRQDAAQADSSVSLVRGWKGLVSAPLDDHSRPVDLRGGTLVVEVDHPGWMQRLQMQQGRILSQVRRRYPQLEVRAISIRVNLKLAAGPAGAAEARPAEQACGDLGEDLEGVREQELRGLLARLYARVVERNRPDDGRKQS